MENKKNNYKKPAMQVVKIQHQGHLLTDSPDPQNPNPEGGNAREQRGSWSSED